MKNLITSLLIMSGSVVVHGQTPITGVFTNYGGFWNSTTSSNSLVKPDSSHMLLAFTYNGTTYATGVDNSILTTQSVAFQSGNFQSFQIPSSSVNAGGSGVIGVGNLYGGGPGNVLPLPVTNDMAQYLSDGVQGLNMGTAVFNIPSSDVNYPVTNFINAALADGIPDIVVTQVGQPPAANSSDSFQFENSAGQIVGNAVAVSLAGINVLGTGYWKFYNPTNPPTYNAGNLGDRPLRMVGFELSDFGLTSANISSVTRFVHKLSGNSDQAFIAYNADAFTANTGVVLPITLLSFNATKSNETALLNWKVEDATKFSHFELERSEAGPNNFNTVYSTTLKEKDGAYTYQDKHPFTGVNYYRLKMVDQDGSFTYSPVSVLDFSAKATIVVYPNPVSDVLYINFPEQGGSVRLYDISGKEIVAELNGASIHQKINVSSLTAGIYTVLITSGNVVTTHSIVVKH